MAEKKPLTINAAYDKKLNKIKIPVTNLEQGDYALRVYPDKSKQEILYKSTRVQSLNKTDSGFECSGSPEALDCSYELKNIKTNSVVASGKIILSVEKTAKATEETVEEKKESKK